MMTEILVVGGAGYIGSHMVHLLSASGYRPIIYDNLSTGHQESVSTEEFCVGDLSDESRLSKVFEQYHIAAVMHFASLISVGESVENPLLYYDNNVHGTTVLLKQMQKYNVKKLIFSSSAAVYGIPESSPIALSHPTRPVNPYGHTKLMVEQMISDCHKAYGLESIVLRYFNASGAWCSVGLGERHDPETHLLPLILQVASRRKSAIKIFGRDYSTLDGTCVRDYIHVRDICGAHLLSLEKLLSGSASATYNLGTGKGYTVQQVIDMAGCVTGCQINYEDASRRNGDPAELVADPSKAMNDLNWRPQFSELESIIEDAWQWEKTLLAETTSREEIEV